MAHDATSRVPFRRRREGKTDYRKRLKLVRSGKVRAVVRHSIKHTVVQLVRYDETGDRIICSATTAQLKKLGWTGSTGNTPAAYLAGLLAGKKAAGQSVREAVLDIGLQTPSKGSKVFATLKGLLDAGIKIAHSKEVLPADDRIRGKHLGKDWVSTQFDQLRERILKG
jgi:large subunit ribosomal protein L18